METPASVCATFRKIVTHFIEFQIIFFAGKTCLVRRFTQGLFPPGQGATIGVDFMIKTVVVDNEKIKVNAINAMRINRITNLILPIYNLNSCKFGIQPVKRDFVPSHKGNNESYKNNNKNKNS